MPESNGRELVTICNSMFYPNQYSNYLVGGNLCNTFILGTPSADDFFLIGSEAEEEDAYPSLTGRVLAADGSPLFEIVRNVLRFNPRDCSKVLGDHIGYEIHDGEGNSIMSVRTVFEFIPKLGRECYVTKISGAFYSRTGELLFSMQDGAFTAMGKSAKMSLGFSSRQTFGMASNLTDQELTLSRLIVLSHGRVFRELSGTFEKQRVCLDGAYIHDARFIGCEIYFSSGDFMFDGEVSFEGGNIQTLGGAERITNLILAFQRGSSLNPPDDIAGSPAKPDAFPAYRDEEPSASSQPAV